MTLPDLTFDDRGLLPVVTQDADSGEVLMLAWADREALEATLTSGRAHYHSRSRGTLWRKGDTSGHVQDVVEVRYDCDGDAVLYRVQQTGPACHTGNRSCFYRAVPGDALGGDRSAQAGESDRGAAAPEPGAVLALLERVVDERLRELPEGSYVRRMHERGLGYVAQKVIEEAGESAVAALEHKDEELAGEAADLLFHLTVLLRERGVALRDVTAVLGRRHAAAPERG